MSEAWICQTCGVEYSPGAAPPTRCPICEDARQWVPPSGQVWTTLDRLRKSHRNSWRLEEPGLWSIKTEPAFAIGQQAYLVQTAHGNLLWDCISLIDEATVGIIRALGGAQAIAIPHPHYYATMLEWSEALGGVPVYLHQADREWMQRPDARVVYWSGESHAITPDAMLVRSGGHFEGYQVLHWKGAILAGDQPQVTPDRRWVTFLWSYPNMVPLGEAAVRRVVASLEPYDYDRIYGAFGRHILTDAKGVVARSAERYIAMLNA